MKLLRPLCYHFEKRSEQKTMNWLKYILIALGLIFLGIIALSVVGLISAAFYYLLVLGVVGIAGYVGYKVIAKSRARELQSRDPITKIEVDAARAARQLEEYKRKYLK